MRFRMKSWAMLGLILIALVLSVGPLSVAYAGTLSGGPATQDSGGAGGGILGLIAFLSPFMIPLIGAVYSEGNYLSDVILGEGENGISRDKVTVLSGQNLLIGTVLGKITLGAVTETHAGNTGNGAMTIDADTPRLANCQAGVYKAICTAAASNSGTFRVYDPKGNVLGDVAVAATFANQIKFVIADGSQDFIVGDTFLITVAAGSLKVKILTPAALDGTQDAYGILGANVDASGGDLPGFAIARLAVAKEAGLVWPGGITDGQKAAALAQLAAKNITTRKGA